MRTLLFALLLGILPQFLPAQIEDLLKDKDVSYVATFETEHDFRLSSKDETSKLQLLKFNYPSDKCFDFNKDNWLAIWLLDGMINSKYKAYDDAAMTVVVGQSILNQRIKKVDIITTFDPATYQEQVKTITSVIYPDDITSFKTSEVIYYNRKTASFQTRLLAIAPMINQRDLTGKITGKNPIAWLKMDSNLGEKLTMGSPDVAWGILYIDNGNVLDINNLSVKKDEQKKTFVDLLFQEAFNMKHEVEDMSGFGCGEKLTKKDLEYMMNSVDTVVTFDPQTQKESVFMVKNDVKSSDIQQISLVQEWYFDHHQYIVSNRLKAVVPRIKVTDETGKFQYNKGMFFLHVSSKI